MPYEALIFRRVFSAIAIIKPNKRTNKEFHFPNSSPEPNIPMTEN